MSGPVAHEQGVDAASAPPVPGRTVVSAQVLVGTFGILAALIVAFLVFDTFLARIDTAEASSRAASAYRKGMQLERAGQLDAAAEQFSTAAAMDRTNTVYALARAHAVLQQGRVDEAQRLLEAVLRRDPTDGEANMLMARVLVRTGRITEAKSYYHRAVYGQWGPGEGGSSTQARFELIALLARTDARKELLAELLPIQDDSLEDIGLRDRIGRLFLQAGSPKRASDVFHDVLRRRPDDPQAYAGLGEAALTLGSYATAQADLAKAARLAPHDTVVAARLDLAEAVLALDPTRRGLRLSERYDRSRRMVQLTRDAVGRCAADAASRALVTTADSTLQAPMTTKPAAMNDAVESNLVLAQRLWAARAPGCPRDATTTGRALALLQDRLAQ